MDFTIAGPRPVHVTPASTAPKPAAPAATQPAAATPASNKEDKKSRYPVQTTLAQDSATPSIPAEVSSPSTMSFGTIFGAIVVFGAGILCGRLWQKRSDANGYTTLASAE